MAWRPFLAVGIMSGLAVLLTRLPLLEPQLFSYDDVNLTYAVDEIDIRKGQPQPPGYPLFVGQMRVARRLGFKRPESVLHGLSLAGSAAAVAALGYGARPMAGARAAGYGAVLLLAHPAFWYAGLTSALRVQLALWSTLIGCTAWRALTAAGTPGRRACLAATVALGLGAGVRPDLAAALLPLWIWSVRRHLGMSLAVLAAVSLAWLVPLMMASGGPNEYLRYLWAYLADQSSLTNAAFGASPRSYGRTLTWLAAWVLGPVPAWLPAVGLWRATAGGPTRLAWLFWGLWAWLPAVFLAVVHVADPGQTLGILPPLCLAGGALLAAAEERLRQSPRAGAAFGTMMALALLPAAALLRDAVPALRAMGHPRHLFALLPAALAAGTLGVRYHWRPYAAALLLPALLLSSAIFFYPHWYYRGEGLLDQLLDDLHSGLSATTYEQMRQTVLADHRAIEALRGAVAQAPGETLIIWHSAPVSWRKLSYYFPTTPIAVLGRTALHPSAAPAIDYWRRSARIPPVRLAAGWQVIWVTNRAPLVEVQRLSSPSGLLQLGPYQIPW